MPAQPVTVLNIELPGFAELSGKLEARELQSLLRALEEMTYATVRLHQGAVSSFSGDSFMATFTEQASGPAAGVLAIETSVEYKERMESLLEEKNLIKAVGFKAGVATANAIISGMDDPGMGSLTVMGEAVKFATRIKDFAGIGQVLVNGDVCDSAKERFDFHALEPLPMRGSSDPLEVYELKGKKRAKLKLDTRSERKIISEMVGRSTEMELVEGQVKKLLYGKGAVVNIIGKAGIGKSRLVAELREQDSMGEVSVQEGRALSMGQNLSYHPIINIIKSWAGITEEDHSVGAMEKLQASIKRVAQQQSGEIFPFIATMMGLPLEAKAKERISGIEGEALEKLILKNLRDLISKASSIRPLIIIIEDMHWADNSSLFLLKSLYKLAHKHPVMFLNVFRPGHERTGDSILKYLEENLKEDHLNIYIDSLNADESKTLIHNLLHKVSLPPEICDLIIRKTEGNPFFIEEVIRSFIDEGIVEINEKGFLVSEKIHQLNIPETINDVILSRIDKLDEKTKELLKTASVIGRNFYYKVLEEAADTIEELDDRLSYLMDVQLISESKKKDEIEYLFKHALSQQATYESIIQNTRKELHVKIAASIEKVFAFNLHEFYGILAYHYEKASVPDKTIHYLILAGEESMKTGSTREAEEYFRDALEINTRHTGSLLEPGILYDLYFSLADACQHNGKSHDAVLFIDEFFGYHGFKVPKNKAVKTLGFILKFLSFLYIIRFPGRFFKKPSTELSEKIILAIGIRGEALTATNPQRFFVETFYFSRYLCEHELNGSKYGPGYLSQISALFFWTGISMKTAERILNITEKHITGPQSASWLKYKFIRRMVDVLNGNWKDEEDIEEVFETSLKQGVFWGTTIHLMFNSLCLLEQGNREGSDLMLKWIDKLADTFESSYSRSQYLRQLGTSYIKFRNMEEAAKVSEIGTGYAARTGHSAVLFICHCNRVIIHCLLNELATAENSLGELEQLLEAHKRTKLYHSTYLIARCHYLLLRYRDNKNDHQLKKELLKESKSLVKNSRNVAFNITEAYRLRASALKETGKISKAVKTYEKGILTAKKIHAHLELSRLYFELGKSMKDPEYKRNKFMGYTADEYLNMAGAMFEKLGMEWDLRELKTFTSQTHTFT